MRIVEKNNSITEVVDLILQKARYQKVVLCIDEKSDMDYVGQVEKGLGKNVTLLKYYYNKTNISSFFDMINDGVRVVIYNVDAEHFYQLQNANVYVLNIFIPQTNLLLPYINNVESVYGENLVVYDCQNMDYTTLLFAYELALYNVWARLLQGDDVDTGIFKNIDHILDDKRTFCFELCNKVKALKTFLQDGYKDVCERELPYYCYLKLYAIWQMLQSVHNNNIEYVDFYKTELSGEQIDKAYMLVTKCDIVDVIKDNNVAIIKLVGAILNRFKIIIKKYFKFNNIKLNKLNKTIKCQAKSLNIDNLLYISYIFNSI